MLGTTSSRLIGAIVMSNFGQQQINIRQIQKLPAALGEEATRYLGRIEALLGLIALEAIGVSNMVNNPETKLIPSTEAEYDSISEETRLLCQSTAVISEVHAALGQGWESSLAKPLPVVFVAWAYILKSIPSFMIPMQGNGAEMNPDGSSTLYQVLLSAAMSRDLFVLWTQLLSEPLLYEADSTIAIHRDAALYKDSMSSESARFSACLTYRLMAGRRFP